MIKMIRRQSSNKPELGLNNDIAIAKMLKLDFFSIFFGRKNSFIKFAQLPNTIKL